MAFPLDTPLRMLQGIDRHLDNLQLATPEFPHINYQQARETADQLRQLLEYDPQTTPELHQQWIQAAARYFFLHDDGEHDWETADGFQDDAAVVSAVALAIQI